MKIERDFVYDPSLVLYLPFRELDGGSFRSRDAYGHLCTNNGATWNLNGLKFDGVDDYIDCGTGNSLNLTNALTLEAWIELQTNLVANGYILSRNLSSGLVVQYSLWVTSGIPEVQVGLENLIWDTNYVSPLNNTHLVFTFQSPNHLLYSDGVLRASQISARTLTSQNYRFLLGARDNTGATQTLFLKGAIALVRIYNRALNANEIRRLYESTKWRFK